MKISIIGSGNVGATAAFFLAEKELGEIVLIDIVEGLPQGKALDMMQSAPLRGMDTNIVGSNDYQDTANSEIVVVTAGLARKPGMSRLDLLKENARIVKSIIESVVQYNPETKIMMVTNPLDAMTYLALKVSGFQRERVFGMGGVLDSARFRYFLARELGVSVKDASALVIGVHGEGMLPLPGHSAANGKPITEIMSKEKIDKLIEQTRGAGAEIVSLLKRGSAYFAPAASVAEMVEAVVKDKKVVLPCSVYLQGEYGLSDICLGTAVRLGKKGVEEVIELELTSEEKDFLNKSAAQLKENLKNLDSYLSDQV
ncbi:malate dehydrogenase [bacterium]|nr:malate dehydrogenase [bacterium]